MDATEPTMSPPPCRVCGCENSDHVFTKDGYELRRCQDCELVAVANPPAPEELAIIYSDDAGYHEDWADPTSDAVRREREMARRQLDAVHGASAPGIGGTLLDVGCSVGLFLEEARAAGWDVRGVEFNESTARAARQLRGLDVITGSLENADLDDASFDVVTLWDVLEHVPDPLATLRAAARVLDPGGSLWIETPNIDGLFPRVSYRAGRRLDYWPHPEPPHHLFQFSPRSLAYTLRAAGFEVASETTRAIPLRYTFGSAAQMRERPMKAAYGAIFAPVAAVGPLVGRGDTLIVRAVRGDAGVPPR